MSHLLYVSVMEKKKKKLHMNNITDETRLQRKQNFLLKSNTSLLNNNNINKGAAKGILYTVSF